MKENNSIEEIDMEISELEKAKELLLASDKGVVKDTAIDNLQMEFENLLTTILCCKPNLKGYQYLIEGLKLVQKDPNSMFLVTKVLYPGIAETCSKKFNTDITASKVERAIRHSIEISIPKMDDDNFKMIFGQRKRKLTNAEYIAYVTQYYKYSKIQDDTSEKQYTK